MFGAVVLGTMTRGFTVCPGTGRTIGFLTMGGLMMTFEPVGLCTDPRGL
jgi:hypothetical protein